jgi:tRNA pseudouridine55 synthase
MISWQPPRLTVRVVCSKGTYIRSLAHDLGARLGCGGCLNRLVRTRVGIFRIEEAIPLDRLEAGGREADWSPWLHPLDSVLTDRPAVTVSDAQREQIRNGQPMMLENSLDETAECRVYGLDGCFIGVLRFNATQKLWCPYKVFG